MTRYMRWLEAERGRSFADYEALWEWSVAELEEFWATIWDFFEVEASAPYSEVLPERVMPGAKWFTGAELNYAQHIFRGKRDSDVAVLHASELRPLGELRWGELREQVACAAAALRELGVEPGDRVVAYLPNIPETLVAFLATASIGAVWSSCSPDFGASSVVDRFAQIEPKVLLCVDGYRYNGKDFDRTETVAGLVREMPTIERTVVVPYLDPLPTSRPSRAPPPGPISSRRAQGAELEFEPVPFDHPLWVLYSSGTTGLPKAIVQGHGGILLEHLKKLHLHLDAQDGRPRLLVHDHRLDDVELPRRGAADARLHRPLRRQPRPPGHGRPLGPGRADRDELLRYQRQLRGGLHEGGRRAIREPRPGAPRRRRLHRLAALARGLRVGLRARRPRHLAVLDQRRHRRLHRVRGRRPAAPGLPRRAPGALAGRRGGGVRRAGKLGRRRGRRARDHRADALDAAVPVGGRGRLALPGQLLRPLTPASGGTATGSRSPHEAPR